MIIDTRTRRWSCLLLFFDGIIWWERIVLCRITHLWFEASHCFPIQRNETWLGKNKNEPSREVTPFLSATFLRSGFPSTLKLVYSSNRMNENLSLNILDNHPIGISFSFYPNRLSLRLALGFYSSSPCSIIGCSPSSFLFSLIDSYES